MPNMKLDQPLYKYPLMPNVYTGPQLPYGTRPQGGAPAPFWYMQKRPEEPMRTRALRAVFEQAAKPVQQRVNRSRHPFAKYRGY